MQRLMNDRGSVGTMVALLIVPIIGFAAIAIDVAALWADRQKLQMGADAAALAIAQDCGRGSCRVPSTTAQSYATANVPGGNVTATVVNAVDPSTGEVRVRTSGVRNHLFAPVLGFSSTTVQAEATARWGTPSGGTSILPLAFSWCEFLAQTGGGIPSATTERVIKFTKTSGTTCTGPSNNVLPGGFGWVVTNTNSCSAKTTAGNTIMSSPGESAPSTCSSTDFSSIQGKTVLLPIFSEAGESGSNGWYRIHAYAAFTITGYHFVGQYSWNANPQCTGNTRCVKGYFTTMVDLSSAFTYSTTAPNLGARVVALTA
jgi:Flp pilus assembly protein TadG